ncbi:MAG: enoyl-CoA hydratase-related protein [Caulobacteraceae bacterium]
MAIADVMPGARKVHVRREEREGGEVAFVTLDDEARLNAMGAELMQRFLTALARLAEDKALRCVVLTGAGGRAFCAGANLADLASISGPRDAVGFIRQVHACCEAVRALPVPVIARINGAALGAGLELAISCDLSVASASARFGMPEVRLGVPSVVEAALLPGLIGWGRAREMLLLGETRDAEAAHAMGLVETVVPPDGLDAAVDTKIAALLAARPEAVKLQKALMRRWENLPTREAIEAGVEAFAEAYLTDEPARAMEAFRAEQERRKGRPEG